MCSQSSPLPRFAGFNLVLLSMFPSIISCYSLIYFTSALKVALDFFQAFITQITFFSFSLSYNNAALFSIKIICFYIQSLFLCRAQVICLFLSLNLIARFTVLFIRILDSLLTGYQLYSAHSIAKSVH